MPLMPILHDGLYLGAFAGIALFVKRAASGFDLRLIGLSGFERLRRPFIRSQAAAAPAWFTATRASGNTAFDDWRDGEIARIEAQRQALAIRLEAFGAFMDKLKRAKDRATFDRFMAEQPLDHPPAGHQTRFAETSADTIDGVDGPGHRPG